MKIVEKNESKIFFVFLNQHSRQNMNNTQYTQHLYVEIASPECTYE
jgi:hypothetical protein